ncbi:hypothetical protein B0F90DRAFT_221443 [Multifurca ochricompacta]|uniref:F-box domain-containing protein n=1 Tax=Multifurca ochricompacta TaxID=376703 RepID=A0AAD4LX31_9AGAM|nr:hypothetical protein B0F90DRAFT_221443 [Multifurca ochricompacta]
MINSTNNDDDLFQLLPDELVTKVLAILNYRDLASCMLVSKRMVHLVHNSSLLQYHLELGRSCMEDGPLNTLSIPERRERLQAYSNAWRTLRYSACIHLYSLDHRTYIMDIAPGGILTFISKTEAKVTFVRLPSNLRGIPMRQWEHSFPFIPHACTLDPSQDILVLLQQDGWRFHFFSLKTGEPHPLAAASSHLLFDHPPSYYRHRVIVQLVVAQNYVAALLPKYQLKVYDWKSGQTMLNITSNDIRSVALLPRNRILLASTRADDLIRDEGLDGLANSSVLAVYDLEQVHASRPHWGRRFPVAVFALELGHNVVPVDMALHYRLDIHSYSPEVAAPFFNAPMEQLVALQTSNLLKASDDRGDRRYEATRAFGIPLCHILLIPIAKLLSYLNAVDERRTRYIQWNDWGATGTRRVPEPHFSPLFRGALSGSRFIPLPESHSFIGIWDFSRSRAAHLRLRHSESVPCVQRDVALPIEIKGQVTAAISEDVIVICEACIIALSSFYCVRLVHTYCRVGIPSPVPLKTEYIFSFFRVLCCAS